MVRKDGDTMKECMKTNNPTEFRNADSRFNEAMDAYERSQGIIYGIGVSNGPDVTAESKVRLKADKNPAVKEEFGYDPQSGTCWHYAKVVNTSCNVNLRAEPTIDSAVIGHIHPDSEFWIAAIRMDGWYKVLLKDGTEGYASSKFVSKVMSDEHT